jgi:hypothetical protein
MKILKWLIIDKCGIDIWISGAWYGLHWYWQSIPLFDVICVHRKMNTVHEYGLIIFGLWVYIRIDQ